MSSIKQEAKDQLQKDFHIRKRALVERGSFNGKAFVLPPAAVIDKEAVWTAINSIDFSGVKLKLTHPKYGLGWSGEEADDAEIWYKRYLFLVRKYPSAFLVPNQHVDEFWHQHILDTKAYAADCQKIFSLYHHHYPYAGMFGGDDYDNWLYNVVVTEQLFRLEFGVEYGDQGEKCTCFGGKCRSVMPA